MNKKVATAALVFAAVVSGLGSAAAERVDIHQIIKFDGQAVVTACYKAKTQQHCPDGVRVDPDPLLRVLGR